jgi:hypothetical protein
MTDYDYTKEDFIEMGYIDENNPVNIDKVLCEINSLFDKLSDRLSKDEHTKFEDTITALKSIQSRVYIMGLQLKNIVEDVYVLKSNVKE